MEKRIIKIYVLQEITGEIRYVGKTIKSIKKRFWGHIYSATKKKEKTHKGNWIRKCVSNGYYPLIKEIDSIEYGEFEDGGLKEIYWIDRFKKQGLNLTNETKGGEGTFGYVMSEEQKNKISKRNKGMIFGEETRKRMSEAKIGTKRTEEEKKFLSDFWMGKKKSEETIKKMIKCKKDYKPSSEAIRLAQLTNIGNKYSTGRVLSDETKNKIGKSHKGINLPESQKIKIGNSLRGKKNNGSNKFIGVYFIEKRTKIKSTIRIYGKTIHLGLFKNEIDAAKAYDNKFFETYGKKPNLEAKLYE